MRMILRTTTGLALGLGLGLGLFPTLAEAEGPASSIIVTIDAGRYDRFETPVQFSIHDEGATEAVRDALRALAADQGAIRLIDRDDRENSRAIPAQVDLIGEDPRLTFVLPGLTPSGTSRTFRVEVGAARETGSPWEFRVSPEGQLELSHGESPVFRYNTKPVRDPDHPDRNQSRNAYIHPAYSPTGAVVTGDYSRESHPHHRGFFLAYTKTEVGGLHPDFWNIQGGSGKIAFDRLGDAVAGPVSARFSAVHRWQAIDPQGIAHDVLRERWDVEAIDVPGAPYWLIDLVSTQRAVDEPLVLPPYRYGGMAYRGPDSFFPKGVLDVLTSQGLGRVDGDQRPARWVDLTGPVDDGHYAGAALLDHPENLHHPTPARIHPTTLPFFCFVPSHDEAVTIGPESPSIFRYRILIHDGHPDADFDERAWRDYAEPPSVTIAIDPGA